MSTIPLVMRQKAIRNKGIQILISTEHMNKANISLPPAELIHSSVQQALAEDIGSGDVSAALIPKTQNTQARIITRNRIVLCGQAWVDSVFQQLDANIKPHWLANDGDIVADGASLCQLQGSARNILTAERTALNFLQNLSGTATLTKQYVDTVANTGVTLLDTRKTLPGWRLAQKYAVRCGGASNHRLGLFDAFLIKENHIRAAGGIMAAVQAARKTQPNLSVEVEVETLAELQQAITVLPDRIMLDNFSIEDLHKAVALTASRVALEASGGITLNNIRAIAETGVEFISLGALTKDIQAADLSLLFE